MRQWRHGIVINGDRLVVRAVRASGTTPRFRLVEGRANPDREGFENQVQGLLGEMDGTGSGGVVFSLLRESGHQVDIFPLSEAGSAREVRTGAYQPRRGISAGEAVLGDRDRPIRMRGDDRTTAVRERPGQRMTGLGGGSDVFVLFSETRFTSVEPHPEYGYLEPVVMLFHELVHAAFLVSGRQPQGSFRHRGFSEPAAAYLSEIWDRPGEFYAVTVENILASELGIRGLRGAHSGFTDGTALQNDSHILLPEPTTVPAGPPAARPGRARGPALAAVSRRPDIRDATDSQMWAWSYVAELQEMQTAFPELWRRLAGITAPFNPIRDTVTGSVP